MSKTNGKKKRVTTALKQSFQRDVDEIRKGSRREISGICQDYLRAIVDTRGAKKVGVPTLAGGMPGRTSIVRYTEQTDIVTGGARFGFLAVNPSHRSSNHVGGPFSNGNTFCGTTDPGYVGSNLPNGGAATPTGVTNFGWSQSPYIASNSNHHDLQWRVVGCTMKIFPEDSALDQNGKVFLLESPSHTVLNASATSATELMSFPTARVLRGTQFQSLTEEVVLNWHPRSGPYVGSSLSSENDFEFADEAGFVASTTISNLNNLIIGVVADEGTAFHIETTCMYEVRGRVVTNVKPRVVDSRGMDLICNILACKMISGYVGHPHQVYEGYLHKAWESAKKIGGFISKHESELMQGAGSAMKAIAGLV